MWELKLKAPFISHVLLEAIACKPKEDIWGVGQGFSVGEKKKKSI